MAARPSWSGHLRISLVTFPIQLFTGTKSTRNIPLRQLHEPTGKRVHNQPVVEGVGAIDRGDIIKGYEYKKDSYVVLTPEEIGKVRLPSKKTIDIVEFVGLEEIDRIYYDKPYYILPQGDVAMDAYATFQQALKQTGKVAIGEVVLSGKEHLAAILPYGRGMMLATLRYADEVRAAHSYFEDLKVVKPDADQLDLAISLIKKKTAKFDVSEFDDSYETALHELIERKLKNLPIEEEKDEYASSNVISLMDALKKSLGDDKPAKKAAAAKKKTPAKAPVKKKRA